MGINPKSWKIGFKWTKGDASNPTGAIGVDNTSKAVHIADIEDIGTDWNVSVDTHPSLYLHSATTPATDYLKINHDATTVTFNGVGATTQAFQLAGTSALELTATALTFADSLNVVLNATTGTKIGTTTAQKLAFWNGTPAAQPSAYTQTYSSADKTHANLTSVTLTDSSGGTSEGTIASLGSAGTAQPSQDWIDAITSLTAQHNALRVDLVDAKQLINSLVDDLQAMGLVG